MATCKINKWKKLDSVQIRYKSYSKEIIDLKARAEIIKCSGEKLEKKKTLLAWISQKFEKYDVKNNNL